MIKDLMRLANRLDSKGLTKEADVIDLVIKKIAEQDDINLEDGDVEFSPYGHYDPHLEVYPEPPVNIEDVKAAFVSQFMSSRILDSLEVTSIRWEDKPAEYPHYVVTSSGKYLSSKTGKIKDYNINTDFSVEDWGTPVQGTDGKTYYFYGED